MEGRCKECVLKYSNEYYKVNKDIISRKSKEKGCVYYYKHKNEIRIKQREYEKRIRIEGTKTAIIRQLRKRLTEAFKNFSKNGKVRKSKEYEIDYEAIFRYIGPCPGDRINYHIDHIIPLSTFNFDDPEQVKKAFAPENHQWLTAKE